MTGLPDQIITLGTGSSADGIVIRAIECLFDKIRSAQSAAAVPSRFLVRASCVEIHNDLVLDLLNPSPAAGRPAAGLPVRFRPATRSFDVPDLSYAACPTERELLIVYMRALRRRAVAAHAANAASSRSHSLFTIYVDSVAAPAPAAGPGAEPAQRVGKVTFVDLAGNERLKQSRSAGPSLREAGHINRSLFTLGKVIASLCDRDGRRRPGPAPAKRAKAASAAAVSAAAAGPFRESKLTQLLMDSLGGRRYPSRLSRPSRPSRPVSRRHTVRAAIECYAYGHRVRGAL